MYGLPSMWATKGNVPVSVNPKRAVHGPSSCCQSMAVAVNAAVFFFPNSRWKVVGTQPMSGVAPSLFAAVSGQVTKGLPKDVIGRALTLASKEEGAPPVDTVVFVADVSRFLHAALHSRAATGTWRSNSKLARVPLKHLYLLAHACTAESTAILDKLECVGGGGLPACGVGCSGVVTFWSFSPLLYLAASTHSHRRDATNDFKLVTRYLAAISQPYLQDALAR